MKTWKIIAPFVVIVIIFLLRFVSFSAGISETLINGTTAIVFFLFLVSFLLFPFSVQEQIRIEGIMLFLIVCAMTMRFLIWR